jgi:hypothetical protein
MTKAPYDIVFAGVESGEKLEFFILYKITLFKEETILTMTRNFKEILSQVLKNRKVKLADIDISFDLMPAASPGLMEEQGDFGF